MKKRIRELTLGSPDLQSWLVVASLLVGLFLVGVFWYGLLIGLALTFMVMFNIALSLRLIVLLVKREMVRFLVLAGLMVISSALTIAAFIAAAYADALM